MPEAAAVRPGTGDGFTRFSQATDAAGGPIDLDALVAYFESAASLISPPPLGRIVLVS